LKTPTLAFALLRPCLPAKGEGEESACVSRRLHSVRGWSGQH